MLMGGINAEGKIFQIAIIGIRSFSEIFALDLSQSCSAVLLTSCTVLYYAVCSVVGACVASVIRQHVPSID